MPYNQTSARHTTHDTKGDTTMCGIFGYAAKHRRHNAPNLERLIEIATAAEARGPHAYGVAWVDARGRLRMFKGVGRITKNLDVLHELADARFVVGHTRWATVGDVDQLANNHPHACDGGWLVHNGTVTRHKKMVNHFGLRTIGESDSEAIAQLVEVSNKETRRERMIDAANIARRYSNKSAIAIVAVWKNSLTIVRGSKPMFASYLGQGAYFSSTEEGLGKTIETVPNLSAVTMHHVGDELEWSTMLDVVKPNANDVVQPKFERRIKAVQYSANAGRYRSADSPSVQWMS